MCVGSRSAAWDFFLWIDFASVKTFFNPAPGEPNMDKSIVALTDIICTNENEARVSFFFFGGGGCKVL